MVKMKLVLGAVIILFSVSACSNVSGQEGQMTASQEEQETLPQEEQETLPQEEQETLPQEEGDFRCQEYAVTIPDSWREKYMVLYCEGEAPDTCLGFYAGGCYEETGGGWLFSLAKFHDDSYIEQPSYEVIEERDGMTYVVIYPTDVQSEGASKKAQKEYRILCKSMESVISSFTIVQD